MDLAVSFLSHPKVFVKYVAHGEPFSLTTYKSTIDPKRFSDGFVHNCVVAVVILMTSVQYNT